MGRFCREYDLSFDDAWSAACLGFCQAVEAYDGRVPFRKYCAWLVEKRLIDLLRQRADDRRELNGIDLDRFGARRTFDASLLFWQLDADGIEAVMIVLDPPGPVKYRAKKKGNTPRAFRLAVRQQLRESGWSDRRIDRTFRRVRRAL